MVGRIGLPHGVRGDVTVEVRTDDPDLRFVPGAVLATDPANRGKLGWGTARDVHTGHGDATGLGFGQSKHLLEQGTLSGTAPPEQDQNFSAVNIQFDAVQHAPRAI